MRESDLDRPSCPTCGARVSSIFDHVDLNCEDADRFDGLFAGQFTPEEYEPLIEAGALRKVYLGAAGFMGLATLERVP